MNKWEHLKISLADVKQATNSFRNVIGRGGYGWVYEGELSFNGKHMKIAAKRLNEIHGQGLKEFLTEIDLLSGQGHEKIIILVGYCDEENEKIIVYEYAEHGSLDRYIWCSNNTKYTLSWLKRLKIVVDAACGLDHLHNHLQNNQVIIHRDIKSSNILLDHNWVAKISDFGLAKFTFSGFDRSTVISHACGTMGYLEPEYIRSGFVSKKSDVYSFGMVLFEVLCGRSCTIRDKDGILLFADIAKEHYESNKLDMLIDPYLFEQISPNALSRFSAIAYKCLLGREHRPPMDVVKKQLEESLKFELKVQHEEIQRLKSMSISCEEDTTPHDFLKKKSRLSEKVVEMEHELRQILLNAEQLEKGFELDILFSNETKDELKLHLENINNLLAEHKVKEAIESEKRKRSLSSEITSLNSLLDSQLTGMTKQTVISATDLKTIVNGLLKLGKGPLAHQLIMKAKVAHLQKKIDQCSCDPETFPATLSKIIFSEILSTTKQTNLMFGDDPVYSNRVIQWAEWHTELFVLLIKKNAPSSETVSALHYASICVQASLSHCTALESQGLKLSKVLLVLLQPYIKEVVELNFRRARKLVFDFTGNNEILPLSPRLASPLSTFSVSSDGLLVDSGTRFIFMVKEIVEQLTRLVILHFGVNVLTRILRLFDQYTDELIKAIPEPLEDDSLVELKEAVPFRAETDSQQLALLGTAFTIAEELLPMVVSIIWSVTDEGKGVNDNIAPLMNNMIDYKDWRKQLQHSLDKLRDHFCRLYVLNFIYSLDEKTRPDAHIYLNIETDDLNWMPSLAFQALFEKLQQLAMVAGDVLIKQEKMQKVLFARLTETVVMWLMFNEEDFWGVLENQGSNLELQGLQQLILDMHFTVEIARYDGYPSRHVYEVASSIISRAIRTFSGGGLSL